jgi:penicillin-binding protein 1A
MSKKRGDLRADPGDRESANRKAKSAPKPRLNGKTRGTAAKTRRPWGKLGQRWWHWAAFSMLWGLVLLVGVLGYFWITLPPIGDLSVSERRASLTLLGADGSLIATFGDLFGEPARIKDLPPYLPGAVIATEDHRFYHHFGIDPLGLARAGVANLRAGHVVQGGSTLTQQLAKNLFLTPDRTFTRKIQEALLALWLESKFTKDEILEIYLNRVYFGAGAYGVDAAAHRYFDKSAREVTLYEAATIAGLLKAPTRFSPARDKALAAERAHHVLDAMVEYGYIDDQQRQAALSGQSQLAVAQRARPSIRYFADWIYEQIPEFAGLADRDLVVTTTLDPKMQEAADTTIQETLDRDGDKNEVGQAALVAMSPDGAIRAMVGGRDYNDSQFNRATQAQRQPGSAFKPILYAAALEHGLTPSDHFNDAPVKIGNWQPRNYENEYRGDVSVADAIAYSINTVAAQVIERTGVDKVIATARQLGITSDLQRDDSLALGTSGVTLLELTTAYAAFAGGGIGAWPYGVVEIKDRDGKTIYRRSGSGPGRVLPADIAGTMNQLLAGVIDHGTGRAAKIARPVAGKTGTTQDFRDALFVGYTADLVAGIWFGNDDNSPMKRVTGGALPARAWHDFMTAATQTMPVKPLPGPSGPLQPQIAVQETPSGPAPSSGAPQQRGPLDRLLDSIFGRSQPAAMQAPPASYPPPPNEPPPNAGGMAQQPPVARYH